MDQTVFRFSPALIALPFAGGILLLGLILWIWQFRGGSLRHHLPLAMLMGLPMGLFLLVAIGPSMAKDRIVVTPREITQYTGPAWSQKPKGFSLDGLDFVHVSLDARKREVWTAFYRDGHSAEVSGGDLWNLHSEAIKQLLRERGVEFR